MRNSAEKDFSLELALKHSACRVVQSCTFVHTYTMTPQDNLSTKQVAALKGVTVKTVNLWAQQGKLPVAETEKLSGARLFDPEVVAQFDPKDAKGVAA